MHPRCPVLLWAVVVLLLPATAAAEPKPRARDLGVPFEGTPGPLNAITDVKGVEVGHTTLISGEGKLQVGAGPVRTGVTAILPRGKDSTDPVFAGWFSLNGNGEMTGTTWIEESGFLEGPVMLTNTTSVGTVRDAVVKWLDAQAASSSSRGCCPSSRRPTTATSTTPTASTSRRSTSSRRWSRPRAGRWRKATSAAAPA